MNILTKALVCGALTLPMAAQAMEFQNTVSSFSDVDIERYLDTGGSTHSERITYADKPGQISLRMGPTVL